MLCILRYPIKGGMTEGLHPNETWQKGLGAEWTPGEATFQWQRLMRREAPSGTVTELILVRGDYMAVIAQLKRE